MHHIKIKKGGQKCLANSQTETGYDPGGLGVHARERGVCGDGRQPNRRQSRHILHIIRRSRRLYHAARCHGRSAGQFCDCHCTGRELDKAEEGPKFEVITLAPKPLCT